mmetsp:Transcript_41658/g.98766  ORF Transcript_41658/g.98766 Transcript_41658/m.98766 type:complete len:250 (-) Transcript_41658:83-832(-)
MSEVPLNTSGESSVGSVKLISGSRTITLSSDPHSVRILSILPPHPLQPFRLPVLLLLARLALGLLRLFPRDHSRRRRCHLGCSREVLEDARDLLSTLLDHPQLESMALRAAHFVALLASGLFLAQWTAAACWRLRVVLVHVLAAHIFNLFELVDHERQLLARRLFAQTPCLLGSLSPLAPHAFRVRVGSVVRRNSPRLEYGILEEEGFHGQAVPSPDLPPVEHHGEPEDLKRFPFMLASPLGKVGIALR